MEKENTTKFSDFKKNEENPFLKQALEEVNKSVVKKYKSAAGTDRKAVLQAVDPNTGELLGHTSFIRQIEVDEEQFTKFYLSNFKVFYGLSEKAMRIFGYIQTRLIPNKDEFTLFMDDCLKQTGYKTKRSAYAALAELIKAEIIARGKVDTLFFINPMVVFNGNRITFVRTYIKRVEDKSLKKQRRLADKDQLSLFEDNVNNPE